MPVRVAPAPCRKRSRPSTALSEPLDVHLPRVGYRPDNDDYRRRSGCSVRRGRSWFRRMRRHPRACAGHPLPGPGAASKACGSVLVGSQGDRPRLGGAPRSRLAVHVGSLPEGSGLPRLDSSPASPCAPRKAMAVPSASSARWRKTCCGCGPSRASRSCGRRRSRSGKPRMTAVAKETNFRIAYRM